MKYIVYITTNIVNKKIYIGVHKTETPYDFDGYLGCGVKVSDRSTYRFCHTPFEYAVNKYGPSKFIRKTLYVFDSLEEALLKEQEIVTNEFIHRKDTYNIALGGGMPPSSCKTIYQYNLQGDFIKEWPSITEAALFYKCSNSTIGQAIFNRTPSLSYLWTEFKTERLDVNNFQIDEHKTKCYLYNINGEFIKEFKSITNCAEYIQENVQKISKSIRGKYCINKLWYCSDFKYDKFPIPDLINHKNDKIYQYDLQGNFIREWDSYKDVCKYFNKPNLGIHASIRLGNTCEGFQWSWTKVNKMKTLSPITKARKVGKYTTDGTLQQVFNTVREAKLDTCGAPHVLSGKRKTAGGYLWKYIDD